MHPADASATNCRSSSCSAGRRGRSRLTRPAVSKVDILAIGTRTSHHNIPSECLTLLEAGPKIPSMSLESGTSKPQQSPAAGPGGAGQRRRLLDDPRTIRALAHPTRLALQSIIGRSGQITAAAAARELGISHALTVHHLRQLEKYGFVQQVEGADHREKPWRIAHTSYDIEDADAQPGGADALAVLEQVGAETALEELGRWQEIRNSWPNGWRKHTGVGRSTIYLTEDELGGLVEAFDALVSAYVEQRPLDDVASRPEGSRAVTMTLIVAPHAPTEAEH